MILQCQECRASFSDAALIEGVCRCSACGSNQVRVGRVDSEGSDIETVALALVDRGAIRPGDAASALSLIGMGKKTEGQLRRLLRKSTHNPSPAN